LDAVGRRVGR